MYIIGNTVNCTVIALLVTDRYTCGDHWVSNINLWSHYVVQLKLMRHCMPKILQ